MALALLLLASSPTRVLAVGISAPRSTLFVFVRGLSSFLTSAQATSQGGDGSDPYFFGTDVGLFSNKSQLGSFLQSQRYPNARYLEYSYAPPISTTSDQPKPYTCQDTYDYPLASHITGLSQQITAAIQNNPNTDVYLVGHSMGGIIAFGYLASLLEHVGNIVPFPRNGSRLKGVITLDSPLGGVTNNTTYKRLIFAVSFTCEGLEGANTVAVSQMQALFQTATSSTARAATASIVQTILKGSALPNQQVANDARRARITLMTIGNTNDLLWKPSVCNKTFKATMQDFSSTQWLQDEGNNSQVYSRMFTSGSLKCLLGPLDRANHFAAFNASAVEQAVAQVVSGSTPSMLLPAPVST